MKTTTKRFPWSRGILGPAIWQRRRIGLLFLSLFLLWGHWAFAQQSFRSQAELQRWEQRIREQLQNERQNLQDTMKERNRVAELARRARDPILQRSSQEVAEDYDRTTIPRQKALIAKLEAQLANPPPVIDDGERERGAQAQRQRDEQAMTYRRMQEERATQQQDRVRQAQEQYQTSQDNKRKRFEVQSERSRQAVETLGQGLTGLVDSLVNSRKNSSDDEEQDTTSIPDRLDTHPKQFVVTDPNLRVPETRERSRVIGQVENGEFIPNPPPPKPAKPLFDSLSSFLAVVGRETASGLGNASLKSLFADGKSDPLESTLKTKLNELADSLLPPDSKVVYYALKGDVQKAQDEAIKLLPPERQFEARANQLPLSVVTRGERGKLSSIWDKDVTERLGMAKDSSMSSKFYDKLTDAAEGMLSKRQPQVKVVTPGAETSFSHLKRDPDSVYWRRLKYMTPEEGSAYLGKERGDWDANKQHAWKSYVPSAASQAEADVIMQKTFRSLEAELKNKDRILKEMEVLRSK